MKKSLGIVLALVMILSSLFVPLTITASAERTEEALTGYYKFEWASDANKYSYTSLDSETFNGRTFMPLWNIKDSGVWSNFKVSYISVSGTPVMRVEAPGNGFLVLLDKDGKPFELQPGHSYTINYKLYQPIMPAYDQFGFLTAASAVEAYGDRWNANFTHWQTGSFTDVVNSNGVKGTKSSVANPLDFAGGLGWTGGSSHKLAITDLNDYINTCNTNGSVATVDGSAWWSDPVSSVTLNQLTVQGTKNAYMPTAADYPSATYNGSTLVTEDANGNVTYNIPYWNGSTQTDYAGVEEYHNYLTVRLNGGTYNGDATKPMTLDFEYIEVIDTSVASVTYCDGDSVIKTVTGTDGAGVTVENCAPVKEGKTFAGWYYDREFKDPVLTSTIDESRRLYARYADKHAAGVTFSSPVKSTDGVTDYDTLYFGYFYNDKYYGKVTNKGYGAKTYTADGLKMHGSNTWHEQSIEGFRNPDGSMFVAKPNTTYELTVNFNAVVNSADYIYMTPFAGIKYDMAIISTEENHNTKDASIADISEHYQHILVSGDNIDRADEKNQSGTAGYAYYYPSNGDNQTVKFQITTGSFANALPAIGLFVRGGQEAANVINNYVTITSMTAKEVAQTLIYKDGETELKRVADSDGTVDFVPENPAGKYFVGWYTDAALTTPLTAEGGTPTVLTNVAFDANLECVLYAKFADIAEVGSTTTLLAQTPDKYNNGYYPVGHISGDAYYAFSGYQGDLAYIKRGTAAGFQSNGLDGWSYSVADDGTKYVTSQKNTWGASSTYYLLNEDGTPYITQPNKSYTINVTYKLYGNAKDNGVYNLQAAAGYQKGKVNHASGNYASKDNEKQGVFIGIAGNSQDGSVTHTATLNVITGAADDNYIPSLQILLEAPAGRVGTELETFVKNGAEVEGYRFEHMEMSIVDISVTCNEVEGKVDYLLPATEGLKLGKSNNSVAMYYGQYDAVTNVTAPAWASIYVFDWNETDKAYELSAKYASSGTKYEIALNAKGFVLVQHWQNKYYANNKGNIAEGFDIASVNTRPTMNALNKLAVGDKVYLEGIDIYKNYLNNNNPDYTKLGTSTAAFNNTAEYVNNAKLVFADNGATYYAPPVNFELGAIKVSVLNFENFEKNDFVQALRIYSSYTLNSDGKVFHDGAYKAITARGVIYTPNSMYNAYTFNKAGVAENGPVFGSEVAVDSAANTTNCWAYDEATNTTTFSNYFINFREEMYKDTTGKYALKFATYVVLEDGTVVMSEATTINIRDIMVEANEFDAYL